MSIGDEQKSRNEGTGLPTEAEAADLLRTLRERAGLSLRAAGKFLGTHHNVVFGWEHDTSKAQIRYLVGLARLSEAPRLTLLRATGGSVRDLLFDENAESEYGRLASALHRYKDNPHVKHSYDHLVATLSEVGARVEADAR